VHSKILSTLNLIILPVILISASLQTQIVQIAKAKPDTIVVPIDYKTIQEAINAADTGNIISVLAGTYYERVTLNKSLKIIGAGSDVTIIDAYGEKNDIGLNIKGDAFNVVASNVTISGLKIQNANVGIILSSNDSYVFNNNITSCRNAIHLFGSNNSILDNHFLDNWWGIYIKDSQNNIISRNSIIESGECIRLEKSKNNKIEGNSLFWIYDQGIFIDRSTENIIVNNTVSPFYKYYPWYQGSLFWIGGGNNIIHHNNFLYYDSVGYNEELENTWDDGKEGNYWSHYNVTDLNGDGIGDSPFIINSKNIDLYPLAHLLADLLDPIPPKAKAKNQITVTSQSVVFDASQSYDNVGIVMYRWDFGDESIYRYGDGVIVNHTYYPHDWEYPPEEYAEYKVTLTVWDLKGNRDSITIKVSVLRDRNRDGIPDVYDSDNDGMPNSWEVRYALNPDNSTDASQDPDNDLLTNLEEFEMNTEPYHYDWNYKLELRFLKIQLYVVTGIAIVIALVLTIMLIRQRKSQLTT
jgi:parallel beta-helix repeat protein